MRKSERLARRFLNDLHGIIVVAKHKRSVHARRILAEEMNQAAAGLIELIDRRIIELAEGDGK